MKSKAIILSICLLFLGANLFSQENKVDTTAFGVPALKLPPLTLPRIFPDSVNLLKLPDAFGITKPEFHDFDIPESALLERKWEHLSYIKRPSPKKPILPFEFSPDLSFNITPSYWEVPILGATTTFAPNLTYSLSERLFVYGGVAFTQYHNLSYVQNIIAPGWATKSNITSQGFLGSAFVLNDRITLRGTYQRSLYNQMPSNLIMFAPAFQTATFGADIDVWNGLGVTVERVWEFDRSGRMRSHMQYSPYVNFGKFMKFLRGY